ncbi:nucleophile aminohydrolase [Piptocephalis cylindrospora]|uniref:Proteasome subunit beta n=1 Tax=Piptocephalis cylindrospora TaxID=1907219 RepID=A0A4P9Y706_9FUNG|nr:nucleophile aminohydrolase [Piptocephalis cylindrospora]|eukprot:RKP14825.1 nucleophile aminohydrolase [Piptocephalis cylindrospora]
MEFLIGITGKDFVLTITDTTQARGITVMKHDEIKSMSLNPHSLMLYSGESGDTVNFAEFIKRNVRLYGIRNNVELSPSAVASFVRGELAQALRSRHPYQVNMLLAGFDPVKDEPSLHWIDYLAASVSVPYASQGYGQYFTLSVLDRHHRPGMNVEEVKAVAKLCVDEMKRRFLVNFAGFTCHIVDKAGIREEKIDL